MSTDNQQIELNNQVQDQVLFSFLGEMMGVIAHDLNNPLMIMMGKADMIKRGVESKKWDDHRVMDSAQKIVETGQKMAKLIEVFRQLSVSRGRSANRTISGGELLEDLEIFFKKKLSYSDGKFEKEVLGNGDKVISVNFMKLGLSLIPWMNMVVELLKDVEGSKDIKMIYNGSDEGASLEIQTPVKIEDHQSYNDPNTISDSNKEFGLNLFLSEQAATSWGAQFQVLEWKPLSMKISWKTEA